MTDFVPGGGMPWGFRADGNDDLVKHIAAGIRSYAIGEANEYDYRGDGSAVVAIRRLVEAADGIASYIVEEWERKGTQV